MKSRDRGEQNGSEPDEGGSAIPDDHLTLWDPLRLAGGMNDVFIDVSAGAQIINLDFTSGRSPLGLTSEAKTVCLGKTDSTIYVSARAHDFSTVLSSLGLSGETILASTTSWATPEILGSAKSDGTVYFSTAAQDFSTVRNPLALNTETVLASAASWASPRTDGTVYLSAADRDFTTVRSPLGLTSDAFVVGCGSLGTSPNWESADMLVLGRTDDTINLSRSGRDFNTVRSLSGLSPEAVIAGSSSLLASPSWRASNTLVLGKTDGTISLLPTTHESRTDRTSLNLTNDVISGGRNSLTMPSTWWKSGSLGIEKSDDSIYLASPTYDFTTGRTSLSLTSEAIASDTGFLLTSPTGRTSWMLGSEKKGGYLNLSGATQDFMTVRNPFRLASEAIVTGSSSLVTSPTWGTSAILGLGKKDSYINLSSAAHEFTSVRSPLGVASDAIFVGSGSLVMPSTWGTSWVLGSEKKDGYLNLSIAGPDFTTFRNPVGLFTGALTRDAEPETSGPDLERATALLKAEIERQKQRIKELEVLASVDTLTSLPNEHRFNKELEDLLENARQGIHPLSFLMLDVDEFKKVNDTHGHDAGDAVLRRLAVILGSVVREKRAMAFRLHGDEFVVLVFEQAMEATDRIAEEICTRVATGECHHEDKTIKFTVSIGGAHLAKRERGEALMKRADEALYRSKRAGRNRFTIS